MFQDARPWLEAGGVLLLSIAGAGVGWFCSNRRFPWWMTGYFVPLIAILLYGLGMHVPSLAVLPPFSWLLAGRMKFAVIGCLAALVLVTPLSRIPRRPARTLILCLLSLMIWQMSVWPFLAPAFNRHSLASLETTMDRNGICRQSNRYTCGPAAAVTALRRLGFEADEGQVAILAHTSSAIGTPPDMLAHALQERYQPEGLLVEHRTFDTIAELGKADLTLVVIKFSFMLDHYVAVLEVTEHEIVLGDPLNGLLRWTHAEFEERWRHIGIVMRRIGPRTALERQPDL